MSVDNAKELAMELVKNNPESMLATIDLNGFPSMRYMHTMSLEDDLTLYYVTGMHTNKCAQIEANPNVSVQWVDMQNWITVDLKGKARVTQEPELLERFWDECLLEYFSGKDDPEYTIIEIKPVQVKYCTGLGYSQVDIL